MATTELNNKLVNDIIKNKKTCIFISPHLDDAVLSAGDLIQYLANKTKVTIVTVFTEASQRPYTFSAKKFLFSSGYKDADDFFSVRKKEDLDMSNSLNIESRHLGFTTAMWRKRENPGYLRRLIGNLIPEILHTYPIYQINIRSNHITKEDKKMMNQIADKLSKIIDSTRDYYIFCPLAVDTHIDHVITREVVRRNFKNVIFWTDYPYSQFSNVRPNFRNKKLKEILRWQENMDLKRKMIMAYKSQTNLLFPDGNIKLKPEVYYEER